MHQACETRNFYACRSFSALLPLDAAGNWLKNQAHDDFYSNFSLARNGRTSPLPFNEQKHQNDQSLTDL